MRLKMLCKVMLTKIVANHGCSVLEGGRVVPVLLTAQLILVMILKHPSQKDIWFQLIKRNEKHLAIEYFQKVFYCGTIFFLEGTVVSDVIQSRAIQKI